MKITDFTLFPRASRLIVVCRRVLTVARVCRRHRRKPMNVTGKRSLRCSDNRSVPRKLNPTSDFKFKQNSLFSKQLNNLFQVNEYLLIKKNLDSKLKKKILFLITLLEWFASKFWLVVKRKKIQQFHFSIQLYKKQSRFNGRWNYCLTVAVNNNWILN